LSQLLSDEQSNNYHTFHNIVIRRACPHTINWPVLSQRTVDDGFIMTLLQQYLKRISHLVILFLQPFGITMGTNCAPLLADLFSYL
jgi:hypothetical protein